MSQGKELESSGGRVNYYLAWVAHPQREEQPPYMAECEDIIDALGCTPDEANILKEIWRTANERTHGKGKVGNNPLRAAQKIVHYGGRILRKAQQAALDVIQKKQQESDMWQQHDQSFSMPDGLFGTDRIVVESMEGVVSQNQAQAYDWRYVKRWYRAG